MIVEPVQGVGGAYDVGKPMLQALRRRCDEVGALLIFDEVQCGVGRTGAPFGANFYGVTPDMITAAKALGNGFPVSALLLSHARRARSSSIDDMGTTFGGGPMACAIAEAVIDAIESESLLANVRQVSTYIRAQLRDRPGHGHAGRRLPARTARPRAPPRRCRRRCSPKNILTGTSGDPHILRLLPAYILERRARRPAARRARARMSGMKRFLDLADFSARADARPARARAVAAGRAASRGRSPARSSGLVFLNPVAAHAGLVPGRHGAPRRQLVRDHARAREPGSWKRGRMRS